MPFTDDFTDTNGVILTSHTPSGGTSWTLTSGNANADIQSNACSGIAAQSTNTYQCDDQGDADCYTQYSAGTINTNHFPASMRMSGSGSTPSYIGARTNSSRVQIFTITAGSFANIGQSGSLTITAGDTIRLEGNGTALEAFQNATSRATATSSLNQTITRQGIAVRTTGTFDNFEAGVLAAAADLLPIIGSGGLIGPSILIGDRSGLIG